MTTVSITVMIALTMKAKKTTRPVIENVDIVVIVITKDNRGGQKLCLFVVQDGRKLIQLRFSNKCSIYI